MASVQEPGTISYYVQKKNGATIFITSGATALWAPGASADAVRSSTANASNQFFLPVKRHVRLEVDDILLKKFTSTAAAADGVDVSDTHMEVPITTANGTVEYLSRSDFTSPTPADFTATPGLESTFGGWKVTKACYLGGGFIFDGIEDDTA